MNKATFSFQTLVLIWNFTRFAILPFQSKEDYDSDRENFQFQLTLLNEQLDRQTTRITELEQLLTAKNELLRKTEAALERERNNLMTASASSAANESTNQSNNAFLRLQSDVSKLRSKCGTLEKENFELRRLLGGDRTPKYLPIHSPNNQQHSPSPSSSTPETEVGIPLQNYFAVASNNEENSPRTPKQSFKKIFGKIKRSNSGGHLGVENGSRGSPQQPIQQQQQQSTKISMVEDSPAQPFR